VLPPTPEQVQTLLSSLNDSPILHGITLPRRGLTGSVFLLETSLGSLILRTFDGTTAAWKPQKEQTVCRLLQRQGIPAPNILAMDYSHALVPFAYTVSECLPGVTLSEAYEHLDRSQRGILYRQFGDMVGRMHALTFEAFGDVDGSTDNISVGPAREIQEEDEASAPGPFQTWQAMHQQIVQSRLHFLRQTEFHDLVDPINLWFERHERLLNYPITPRLLHMDLHMSNLLVSEGQITGILDVGESVIGHNEYDLMRLELAHFGLGYEAVQEAFQEGYSKHLMLDDGYERRKPFYELSRWLVGLKCLVLYGSRLGGEPEKQETRARIHHLLPVEV
jgi:fructosamine-3-kinase